MHHPTIDLLDAGLEHVRQSPAESGHVELIVRRPAVDEREELLEGDLDPSFGLVGDSWFQRQTPTTRDGSPNADKQINVMNARVAALVAGEDHRRQLAGDQLYVDLDISEANLPAGTRLAVGQAVLVVTPAPHLGCSKFASRFGMDALRFVNSPAGRTLRLRGLNARVLEAGRVRVGDAVRKLAD